MKWPPWAQNAWYFVALGFLSAILFSPWVWFAARFNNCDVCTAFPILLVVWLLVLLSPLFVEIDFWGAKIRRQIEDAKRELEHKLQILRMEVRTTVSQTVINQFARPQSHSDLELELRRFESDRQSRVGKDWPPPSQREATENKILNTLWTFQVKYHPDYSYIWTFRVHSNTPVFLEFNRARARLIEELLVSETNEGQLFLTPFGFQYGQRFHSQLPPDRFFDEEPLDPEWNARLRIALRADPFNPPQIPPLPPQ